MEKEIAIQVKDLSKRYHLQNPQTDKEGREVREVWALKDIFLEIYKGESVGIIGANGSGKSTLLKILAGVTKPTTGSIQIKGRVASILDIGAGFHPELSGRENVFLNGQILGFKKSEIRDKYKDIVEFSGIEKFIEEPVKNYSNGMYLRLAFSIMAHLDFDIYLFDEVFSVGDAAFTQKTRKKFQDLLNSNKTMIFVSHNILDLESHDQYILIDKGIISESSNSMSLLENYMEESFDFNKDQIKATQYNSIKTDFSDFPNSDEVEMKKFEFYQSGNDKFRTDEKFYIEIEFNKLKDESTIDLMIRISESQSIALFTTSPLIKSGFSSISKRGTYRYICEIPSFIFYEKLYIIDILFLKNGLSRLDNYLESTINEDNESLAHAERPFVLKKVLVFKPDFKNKSFKNLDLNILNTSVGLAPAFNWSYEKIN